MATVTLLYPLSAFDLPGSAAGYNFSSQIGNPGIDTFTAANGMAAYCYGVITNPLGGDLSTYTEVQFDLGFTGAPELRITGLNFSISAGDRFNFDGDLFGLLFDLLEGDDTVTGTPDADEFFGAEGNDTLNGAGGDDALFGSNGNDTLIGGAGGDQLNGGSGNNTASYATSGAGLLINLETPSFNTGDAAGDTYNGIANLTGSPHNDTLYGDGSANVLSGGTGNDGLVGKAGGDTFNGGSGTDTVLYDVSGAVRADLLNPGTNTNDAAGDSYISIENLDGSSENDMLLGNNGANVIRGNHFPNLPSGNDTLSGRGGNDQLFGHDGNDVLAGGLGRDILTGGLGADRFDFNAIKESKTGRQRDKIVDFSRGQGDKVDLKDLPGKFKFIGKQGFHDDKGELRYEDNGSKVIVQGDVNGDGKADFEIFVNVGALSKGDFLL